MPDIDVHQLANNLWKRALVVIQVPFGLATTLWRIIEIDDAALRTVPRGTLATTIPRRKHSRKFEPVATGSPPNQNKTKTENRTPSRGCGALRKKTKLCHAPWFRADPVLPAPI
jgi:hypothetical protein